MGVCSSSDGAGLSPAEKAALKQEQDRNKQVEKEVKDAETLEQRVNKLLLLGAGSSGKSTLFKQMITIYGKGFGEAERKSYTNIIYNNVLTAMRTLCLHSSKYGVVDERLADSKKILEAEMKEDQPVTEELGAHIQALWADPAILTTYEHQAEFQLTDSAKYFFDKIDEVSKFGYVPTEQDVLRCRAPTTGIVENTFEIEGNTFKMFDVGGQRNERKKWIHCFENVTAVLFVAAISEYNQVLYEDETQNRMVESLTLFDEICNSKWFRKTSMILMLNKRDLFAEKIVKWPLSDYFRDYDGDNSYDACVEWIQARFEEKNQEHDKQIYTHITCATDTNNIKIVFAAVKDTIIRKNLTRVGLL